jgi:hypothetical protein
MKKIIIFSLLSVFLLSSQISFAETYPDACDSSAQIILNATGGCLAIDCNVFFDICGKCCPLIDIYIPDELPPPISFDEAYPQTISSTSPYVFPESTEPVEHLDSSTKTSDQDSSLFQTKNPIEYIIEGFKSAFDSLLIFFRLK